MMTWGHSDEDHHSCLINCLGKTKKIGMTLNAERNNLKEMS